MPRILALRRHQDSAPRPASPRRRIAHLLVTVLSGELVGARGVFSASQERSPLRDLGSRIEGHDRLPFLAVSGVDGDLEIWDTDELRALRTAEGHPGHTVTDLAFGSRLASRDPTTPR